MPGQTRLEYADLARGLGVGGNQREHLTEVVQRDLLAPEHALDPAEVEPCSRWLGRSVDRGFTAPEIRLLDRSVSYP